MATIVHSSIGSPLTFLHNNEISNGIGSLVDHLLQPLLIGDWSNPQVGQQGALQALGEDRLHLLERQPFNDWGGLIM